MPLPSDLVIEKLLDLAKENPKDKTLKFIAEDYDKLEIQPQCGNETLMKLIGPSHGYETHAPSLMVKIYQNVEAAKRDSDLMTIISQLMKGLLPEVWNSRNHENLIVYEELPGFTNIALGLIEGTTVNKVALQNFAKYLALLHNAWSKLPEDELVELKSKVPNVHSPFRRTDGTILDGSADEECISDVPTQDMRETISKIYNRDEGLTLGPYSIADIYVRNHEVKILNIGKAQMGPCASDVAILLGSLIKLYIHHMLTAEENDRHRRVAYKLMDACKLAVDSYVEHASWTRCENREEFVSCFVSDVAIITGAWLIRDNTERPEVNNQNAEMRAAGTRLLRGFNNIQDVSRLLFIALQLC